MNPKETMLSVEGLTVAFGGVKALDDINFRLTAHRIAAVIGPNGAGKSTLFNCISGLQVPTSGTVSRAGVALTGQTPNQLSAAGLSRTFQNLALLPDATVEENILLGRYRHGRAGLISGLFRGFAERRDERKQSTIVGDIVGEFGLYDVLQSEVRSLSYGVRKKVELARALVQEPTLLLLDEPMAGIDSSEKPALCDLIQQIVAERDLKILMVEHDMSVIMGLAEEIVVLDFGKKIAQGTPSEIQRDPMVIEAYLGADFNPTPDRTHVSNGHVAALHETS